MKVKTIEYLESIGFKVSNKLKSSAGLPVFAKNGVNMPEEYKNQAEAHLYHPEVYQAAVAAGWALED